MTDVDRLASIFADHSFKIDGINRLVLQPNSILREFKTLNYGFLFVVRGQSTMSVNGTIYELQAGSVFHAAPGMQLDSQVDGHSEYEYYLLFYSFDPLQEGDRVEECSSHFKWDSGANPRVVELLVMLQEQLHVQGGMGKLRVKELFMSIMVQVLTGCNQRGSGASPSEKVIAQAISYIHGHYMNLLTLDELAELHGMTAKRFSYFFHKITGFRPIDYVIHYRMERAGELLKSGNYLIRDVAISVGYTNPLYFSRMFKNKFGVSPSDYARLDAASIRQ